MCDGMHPAFNIADGTMTNDLMKKEDVGWSEDGDGCQC